MAAKSPEQGRQSAPPATDADELDATVEPSRLGPAEREAAWERLSTEQFDVVVVGGGVVGVGAALDAATRGLTVALVEARDLAAGTSSRSSKLFHGGLRYLEQLDFGLVREALHERELNMTRLAPHLIKPVAFLYPLTHNVWERPYVTAGITLYDTMGGKSSLPKQKQLTRSGALRMAPALKRDALVGAVRYYDAQADDARHTMMVARTAAQYGNAGGPLALVLVSFGVDPMTGRAAAAAAGHGFLPGWTIAITGDMFYFALLMISTLWLGAALGDDRLTIGVMLFVMLVLPAILRRWRRATTAGNGVDTNSATGHPGKSASRRS